MPPDKKKKRGRPAKSVEPSGVKEEPEGKPKRMRLAKSAEVTDTKPKRVLKNKPEAVEKPKRKPKEIKAEKSTKQSRVVDLDIVLKEMEHIKSMTDVKRVMQEIKQQGIQLGPRDLNDIREINRMEDLAITKSLPALSQTKTSASMQQKRLQDPKDYLEVSEDPTGKALIKLFMPPYQIEDV
jgi:hypothetical protein